MSRVIIVCIAAAYKRRTQKKQQSDQPICTHFIHLPHLTFQTKSIPCSNGKSKTDPLPGSRFWHAFIAWQ
ncbi:hypothetical protein XYCOK13_05470 [Xylanibacillus composti]|uniref:Uncharacterized protein n=1 Tax=Xylanibacillus composti TaxID=1572762 RepID=A0A8J4GYT8_9BACL|nr:hypothetical protein XYCOK13_05470 [Xylanibacillus composti]